MDFNIRPPGRLQHICLSVNYAGRIYHPFLGWSLDHPRINGLQTVFAVTGAAMMVRRSLFVQAGGFLEDYGMGTFEDVDLCMMSRELGLNVVTVPAAEAVHYTNATAEQLKLGFPMHINDSLFKARWGSKLIWWDFFTL
jgi:GT2 family glycosyltransferase